MTKLLFIAMLTAGAVGDVTATSFNINPLPESVSCALLAGAISMIGYMFRRKPN
jgi:hypothetical protein